MIKSLLLLTIDTVCSNDVSLLLKTANEIPDYIKEFLMSTLVHNKKWNLLEIENISDATLFNTFKYTGLKCPSCASLLNDKKDADALYNEHFNRYPQRKRMRLAVDKQHFCAVDKKFVCENCKLVCNCYRQTVLCKSCKTEKMVQCKHCNGKCFSSCHRLHYHQYDDREGNETPLQRFCPLNKKVWVCSKPFCSRLVDLNCTLCNPIGKKHICDVCREGSDSDSSSSEESLPSSPEHGHIEVDPESFFY